jgi:hypothetical protein
VKALVFEILPSYVSRVGIRTLVHHLETLRDLWSDRSSSYRIQGDARAKLKADVGPDAPFTVQEWEEALGCLALCQPTKSKAATLLANDTAISTLQQLIATFRRGMVSDCLTMTLRLLLLNLGEHSVERLFTEFWQETMPEKYTSTEARAFGEFLRKKQLDVPYLYDILDIECAAITTRVECEDAVATVSVDPHQLLAALGAGVMPSGLDEGEFEIEFNATAIVALETSEFVIPH